MTLSTFGAIAALHIYLLAGLRLYICRMIDLIQQTLRFEHIAFRQVLQFVGILVHLFIANITAQPC